MKTHFHALLFLALTPLVVRAETPAAPQRKEVTLKLTANSTREEIKAALAARGATASDEEIDAVMRKLAAAAKAAKQAKPPASAAPGKQVSLALTPDSTREEVKAALAAQGVPASDEQVDGVMKQLAAAKKSHAKPLAASPASATAGALKKLTKDSSDADIRAALAARSLAASDSRVANLAAMLERGRNPSAKPSEPTPVAAPAGKPSDALRAVLAGMSGMDLEYNPQLNLYHATTLVNGVPALFTIDSGAFSSGISTEFCQQLGLATQADGTAKGIGGETVNYSTRVESLVVAPNLHVAGRKMEASPMNTVTGAESEACDGLVGADLLAAIDAVIDYGTHRMTYPVPGTKKPDLAAGAKAAGYRAIPLKALGGYSILETTVKGHPVRLVVDTGAQQSVFDSGLVERLGYKTIAGDQVAIGIGDKRQALSVASIDDLPLADGVSLYRTPVSVMPLDHLQGSDFGHIDGILGADFFHAAGLVFDVSGHTFYMKPGQIDGRAYTTTAGEMFASDAELKKNYDGSPRVIAAKVTGYAPTENTTTDPHGVVWRSIMVTVTVDEALKGEAEVGSSENFFIILPDSECTNANLTGLLGRNSSKLLFLGPKAEIGQSVAAKPFSVVWTDGKLARNQLKRIQK